MIFFVSRAIFHSASYSGYEIFQDLDFLYLIRVNDLLDFHL